jgi:hypothetical protein
MERRDYLFMETDSHSVQEGQRRGMQAEIASMDGNRLLNTNVDDLVAYFADKYGIEAPELLEDQMSADQHEAQRDVSGDPNRMAYFLGDRGPVVVTGTEITVEIAFSGDPQMFRVRPSTFNHNPPTGVITGSTISINIWGDNLIGEAVRQKIDAWVADVKQWLDWQRGSFQGFNDAIAREARQAIEHRRAKLLQSQNLVAGLGIPLKRRSDAPTTYTAPEVKRKLSPKLPPATTGPYRTEPILEDAEYEHILTVMEGMVKVMERSPKAFHGLDEEGIRSHFLVQLNGHYDGQAPAKHSIIKARRTF